MVTGAIVSITDDLGNSTSLIEVSDGIYKSDVLALRGVAGRAIYSQHTYSRRKRV